MSQYDLRSPHLSSAEEDRQRDGTANRREQCGVMTATKRARRRLGPPEGRLIEDARETLGLSQRAAARLVGISHTRWRNLVLGEKVRLDGRRIIGGAEVFARMAKAMGLRAELFEKIRPDIAAELRHLMASQNVSVVAAPLTVDQVAIMLTNISSKTDEQTFREALHMIGLYPSTQDGAEVQ